VSITLRGWRWSDGEKVDAADVIFWLNMDEAEKDNLAGYVRGELPDNLISYHVAGPDTVVLRLTRPYGSTWFTYNELAQITPMPLAWDVSSSGARASSGGCERDSAADHWARCKAVYAYLTGQSRDFGSYASPSSVWRVTDGPWRLSVFRFSGPVTMVPSRTYSGWPKPALSELKFVAFPDDAALFTALKAGRIDVAAVPQQYLPAKPPGRMLPAGDPAGKSNYLQSAYSFAINYYMLDFRDRRDSDLFDELYFRQALQELTDQQAIARVADRGYAVPTTAGVPDVPRSTWISSDMTAHNGAGLYPYDPARAESLLAAHGWSVIRGTLTCERPGKLASECGPGIRKGLTADLGAVMDWSGTVTPQTALGVVKADLGVAGIRVTSAYGETLVGPGPCAQGCELALQYLGGWEFNGPGYAPTGDLLFKTGAPWNFGLYSSATMDSLISAVQESNSRSAFDAYADYTASQLPVIWLPDPYAVVAVNSRLHGVSQSPLGSFYPEYWYFARPARH